MSAVWRCLALCLGFLLVLLPSLAAKAAPGETILYSFCQKGGCPDGQTPGAGVVADAAGNLYGTTNYGGADGRGIVFKLTPDGQQSVLYSFCSLTDCADGLNPSSSVVIGADDTLYGTTQGGGTACPAPLYSCGVVYAVTQAGKENVVYAFCAKANCVDGAQPEGSLAADGAGRYVGVTAAGGVNCQSSGGCGTVYELTTGGRENVLYSFCAQPDCADGDAPQAGLIHDMKGNLYGTANGGINGHGIVYELVRPTGSSKTWTVQVLYSFCAQTNCTDGYYPGAALVMDNNGNLFGTTRFGGDVGISAIGGAVFSLSPPTGGATAWTYRLLLSLDGGQIGTRPYGGVVLDAKGNLYGTTSQGGNNSYGTVYRLAPDGTVTVLHAFGSTATDGAMPFAGLMAKGGVLYGTTSAGGAARPDSYGTVFRIHE